MQDHYSKINKLVEKVQNKDFSVLGELYEYYRPLLESAFKRCSTKESRLQEYKEDFQGELLLILKDLTLAYDRKLSYFTYYLSMRIDYAIYARAKKILNLHTTGEEINFSDMPETWEATYQEDPFGKINEIVAIDTALGYLSKKHYEVIDLYFYKGLNQEESAEFLGITQASFSRRLNRALSKLKIWLAS